MCSVSSLNTCFPQERNQKILVIVGISLVTIGVALLVLSHFIPTIAGINAHTAFSLYQAALGCGISLTAIGLLVNACRSYFAQRIAKSSATEATEVPKRMWHTDEKLEIARVFGDDVDILHILRETPSGEFQFLGRGCKRVVHRIGNTDLLVKSGPYGLEYSENSLLDCLAYEISKQWEFNMVPYTRLVEADSEEGKNIQRILPDLRPGEIFILTRLIDENTSSFCEPSTEELIIQNQLAVFFNLLIGRIDSKLENSVVDIDGKVWEIDNEQMGYGVDQMNHLLDAHWLRQIIGEREIHLDVFKKLESLESLVLSAASYPVKVFYTCPKDYSSTDNIRRVEQNVNRNLEIIKTHIRALRGKKITLNAFILSMPRLK